MALLSARPILAGAAACQATGCVLIRYRCSGARSASEAEDCSFRFIAAECSRYGVSVVDHLVVIASGGFSSAFRNGS
jgi:DNA repair protein RadC